MTAFVNYTKLEPPTPRYVLSASNFLPTFTLLFRLQVCTASSYLMLRFVVEVEVEAEIGCNTVETHCLIH